MLVSSKQRWLRIGVALMTCWLAAAHTHAGTSGPSEAIRLASAIVRSHPYLLDAELRVELDEVIRGLREAEAQETLETGDADDSDTAVELAAAEERLPALLGRTPTLVRLSVGVDPPPISMAPSIELPGDVGAVLVRVHGGDAGEHYVTEQLTLEGTAPGTGIDLPIENTPDGVTWALIGLSGVPAGAHTIRLGLRRPDGDATCVPITIRSPEMGRLKITVRSAKTGRTVPSMVRLIWKTNGEVRRPDNALEFASQLDGMGEGWIDPGRHANLPGRLAGTYWCVPEPLDMTVPPGEWEVTIRRGLEHVPAYEALTIKSGQTLERTYVPARWVDMRELGWYSGDDHVHCQVLSDADAENLMTYVEAEDIHVANILEMGDHHGTWFQQRGFGKEHRVRRGDYVLVPGQEDPRTEELGHLLGLDIRSLIRDTDRYYLYDWVCDAIHDQGGLTGYAHVTVKLFQVHRGMSLDVPGDRIDFIELLQYMTLNTDLYYEFLNLGFKLAAAAGSDIPWGRTIGEVRTYAHVGDEGFSADRWFEGLRRGHTFVTNGPMIELRVEDGMPGDEIVVTEDRPLRVRARAWGDSRRTLPERLEVVRHGEVVGATEPSEGADPELSLDFEIPSAHGFWIAARAEGSNGARAHTTPVYVIREGLRFWKFDALEHLVARRLDNLNEVEEGVAEADRLAEKGNVEPHQANIRQTVALKAEILQRVEEARGFYTDLLTEVAAQEARIRDESP